MTDRGSNKLPKFGSLHFYELITRWICEKNPKDLGNNPSGAQELDGTEKEVAFFFFFLNKPRFRKLVLVGWCHKSKLRSQSVQNQLISKSTHIRRCFSWLSQTHPPGNSNTGSTVEATLALPLSLPTLAAALQPTSIQPAAPFFCCFSTINVISAFIDTCSGLYLAGICCLDHCLILFFFLWKHTLGGPTKRCSAIFCRLPGESCKSSLLHLGTEVS